MTNKKKDKILITGIITFFLISAFFPIQGQGFESSQQAGATPFNFSPTQKVGDVSSKILISPDGERIFLETSPGVGVSRFLPKAVSENYREEEFDGYIAELKEQPLLVIKAKRDKILKSKITPLEQSLRKAITKAEKESIQKQINDTIQLENINTQISLSQQRILIQKEQNQVEAIIKTLAPKAQIKRKFIKAFNGFSIRQISASQVQELRNKGYQVWPNYKVKATLMDSVPLIGAKSVWENITDPQGNPVTGRGITIGIIDTGVDYTHPDLGGCLGEICKVIEGYDFVNNDFDPMDDHGHGTHVGGIAAGNGVLKGVAPDAKLYAYKVLNSGGSGYFDWVIAGIERAVDPNQDNDFSDHLDVINLSLGGWGNPDDPLSKAIDNTVAVGVVAAIAAGNWGPGLQSIASPGTAREAITVAASNKQDEIAGFSSRGPVVWEDEEGNTQYLAKPDVVAPGVNICSAQYDSAWNEYKCYDDKHVSISGTSMAAPHVAGVVALLKQKNPDWTPDEIKMALRNTAVNIVGTDREQGYGRIDVKKAIGLGRKPMIANLNIGKYDVSGEFNIIGTAKGEGFERYEVYYQRNKYEFLICRGYKQIENNILCGNFNTLDMDDGEINLKLVVYDTDGINSTDKTAININNFEIKSIGDTFNYLNGREVIKGKIKTPNYKAYKVEYRNKDEEKWTEICYYKSRRVRDNLCSINVNSLENGEYLFRLSILRNGIWLKDVNFKAAVIKELMNKWPVELPCSPRTPLVATDLNNDGINKIIHVSPNECGMGWMSGELNIYLFKNNARYEKITNLYKAGAFYSSLYAYDPPSIINGKMALNTYYFIGVIDDKGNFQDDWPYYLADWGDINAPTIVNNKLFLLRRNWDNIFLYGFDYYGNLLSNFPVEIKKEKGFEEGWLILRQIGLIKSDGKNYLGVIVGNSDSRDEGGSGKLFFDIYSETGTLVKRTILSDDSLKNNVDYRGLSFAVADLNNDGNSEVAVGFMVFDLDKFRKNYLDLEAYNSYLKVLDSDGNIISEPFDIQGYTIKNIRIGNFDRGKPDIVFALEDTFPTTYNGQRLITMDYEGNKMFETVLDDYNKIIGEISAGDVNGDGNSEILIAYTPRWWSGKPSGILIYNKTGVLERELLIPTFGEVEVLEWGSGPVLTDFDGDGKLDIVQQTLYVPPNFIGEWKSHIFAFKLDAPYNPDKMDWPMFQHDPQHTSCYKCEEHPTSTPSITGISATNVQVGQQVTVYGSGFLSTNNTLIFESTYPSIPSAYSGIRQFTLSSINGTELTFTIPSTVLQSSEAYTGTKEVPVVTGQYQISVDNQNGKSGVVFLQVTIQPPIVVYPNGGEILTVGSQVNIRWQASGSSASSAYVILEVRKGSLPYIMISNLALNTGSYTWTPPSGLVGMSDLKIRVTDETNRNVYDESDGYFSVVAQMGLKNIETQLASISKIISELVGKIKELMGR